MATDTATVPTCPVCGRDTFMHKRTKQLYGQTVCRKCWGGFVNRRQGAYIIDWVLFAVVNFMAGIVLGLVLLAMGRDPSDDAYSALTTLIGLGVVSALFLSRDVTAGPGRSIGKALLGVQTLDRATGRPIGLGTSLKRNFPLMIPFLPLVIALQISNGPRLGDRWSNTAVVWNRYADGPLFRSLLQITPEQRGEAELAYQAELGETATDDNPYRAPSR